MATISVAPATITAQVRQLSGASLTAAVNAAVDAELARIDLDGIARAALNDTDTAALVVTALVNMVQSAVETRYKNALALAIKNQIASVVETHGPGYIASLIPQVFSGAVIDL